MKTGFLILQNVSDYLMSQNIKSLIDGDVYKLSRLNNSKKTDIVLGVLSLTGEQVVKGFINVNIHVPNLSIPITGSIDTDKSQPDYVKLFTIAEQVIVLLDNKRVGDYWLSIYNPALPFQDEDGSWYANIKVNYNSVNKNFK